MAKKKRKHSGLEAVQIIKPGKGRRYYILRWLEGQKRREHSTGTTRYREAYQQAVELEERLLHGYSETGGSWLSFVQRYETQHLAGRAKNTRELWQTVLTWVTDIIQPIEVSDITEQRISTLVKQLRAKPTTENTIACYLRHLQAALNWGQEQRIIQRVPAMPHPIPPAQYPCPAQRGW